MFSDSIYQEKNSLSSDVCCILALQTFFRAFYLIKHHAQFFLPEVKMICSVHFSTFKSVAQKLNSQEQLTLLAARVAQILVHGHWQHCHIFDFASGTTVQTTSY